MERVKVFLNKWIDPDQKWALSHWPLYRPIIKKWYVLREVLKDRHTHTHLFRIVSPSTDGQMLYDLPWKCSCVLCIATTGNWYKFCTEYRMNVFPSDLWAVKFIKWPIFYKHINFFLLSLSQCGGNAANSLRKWSYPLWNAFSWLHLWPKQYFSQICSSFYWSFTIY